MALFPCAIAGASSKSTVPVLLSLHSASPQFDHCSSKSVSPAWFRPQGLGTQSWRDASSRRRLRIRSSGDSDGDRDLRDGESDSKESASNSGRVEIEVSPAAMKQLESMKKKQENVGKGFTISNMMDILDEVVKTGGGDSSMSLIEQNMKKRRERQQGKAESDKVPEANAPVPLSSMWTLATTRIGLTALILLAWKSSERRCWRLTH